MDRIIARCGIICSECEAFVATQANDGDALRALAQKAREEFGQEDATAQTVMCDGCLADDGRQISYCAVCEIRACSTERNVVNCAYCSDYACERLEAFFERATDARTVLNEIHSSL
jgi:hypothetical protein